MLGTKSVCFKVSKVVNYEISVFESKLGAEGWRSVSLLWEEVGQAELCVLSI